MSFRWWADDDPPLVLFVPFLPLSPHPKKKKKSQGWTPLAKLSVFAHELSLLSDMVGLLNKCKCLFQRKCAFCHSVISEANASVWVILNVVSPLIHF